MAARAEWEGEENCINSGPEIEDKNVDVDRDVGCSSQQGKKRPNSLIL
jgi:hypothetical protein